MYALMQSAGMLDDHVKGCRQVPRLSHREILAMRGSGVEFSNNDVKAG